MRRLTVRDVCTYGVLIVLFCLLMQGWHEIIGFLCIVLAAVAPLVVGLGIAYVVAIPTRFVERHLFPRATSKVLNDLRHPLSLGITVIIVLVGLVLSTSVLIPAFVETITMVQKNGRAFIESVLALPVMEPVRDSVHDFLSGDFMTSLSRLDIKGLVSQVAGGTVGSITTEVFTVVSTVMTGFFGMLFSFILLTDTSNVQYKLVRVTKAYLGPRRTQRLATVISVADASFHNFIVRQFVEAMILGSVGAAVLLVAHVPYALGIGVLMGLAALVPVVGYPVGLFAGAFMVAINNVWLALVYLVVVGFAQMLEATFVLPHVGDPRTVLPPVWVTVGVTIGGGVAGFFGMLLAIPLASTIRQLIIKGAHEREAAGGVEEVAAGEPTAAASMSSRRAPGHLGTPDAPKPRTIR